MNHPAELSHTQPTLRLWPGLLAVAILWLGRFGLPAILPEGASYSIMIGLILGVLGFVAWWAIFSKAQSAERWGALGLMVLALVVTRLILHPSIAEGMMGFMFFLYGIPTLCLAFVLWALASRWLAGKWRSVSMIATILLSCGAWALVRTDGIMGDGASQFAWRWSPTAEERLLAQPTAELAALPASATTAETPQAPVANAAVTPVPVVAATPANAQVTAAPAITQALSRAEWPGFRGPQRDSVIRGVRINTDWATTPPVQLWRQPVGPGWSSFAVQGERIYTQEQRGNDELVACYETATGKLIWKHHDAARFWESNAGAGPRATPTVSNGRVYSLGATGLVNALDDRTGRVIWSRNAATDTGAKIPGWGFAGSPVIVNDLVIVAAAGALIAYESATGKPRWTGQARGGGYSSPQLLTISGVQQVLFQSETGLLSVTPADGKQLWEHSWEGVPMLQPALTADGDLLITTGDMNGGAGTRRLAVKNEVTGWRVEERWTSNGLKPYFNDFVVHQGFAFGFDGRILACIDLKDGKRKWKGGRYGQGQMMLLADQNLLLILSEEGELALVAATSDQFTELAKVPALEGKTWNHPVLVGERLLVRNSQEMAAYQLPITKQ